MINKLFIVAFISLLTACASTPDFDTAQVDHSLTPQSVTTEAGLHLGKTALWGGIILDTRNLEEDTQIEVLAYPLNTEYRPLVEKKPLGRFIIQHQGYLEATTYAQGREICVLGKVSHIKEGNVGESKYTYAVIASEKIHVWSLDSGRDRTSFHFGVGIGL